MRFILTLFFISFSLWPQAQTQEFELIALQRDSFCNPLVDGVIIAQDCDRSLFGLADTYGKEILPSVYQDIERIEWGQEWFFYVQGENESFMLDREGKRIDLPQSILTPDLTTEEVQGFFSKLSYNAMNRGESLIGYYDALEWYSQSSLVLWYFQDFVNLEEGKQLLFKTPMKSWNRDVKKGLLWVETEAYNYVFDSDFTLLFQTRQKIIDVLNGYVVVADPKDYDPRLWNSYLRDEHRLHRHPLLGYDTRRNKALVDFQGREIFPAENESYAIYQDPNGKTLFWIKNHAYHHVYDSSGKVLSGPLEIGAVKRPAAFMNFTKKKKKYKEEELFSDPYYKEVKSLSMLNDSSIHYLLYKDPKNALFGLVDRQGKVHLEGKYDKMQSLNRSWLSMPNNFAIGEIEMADYYSGSWIYSSPWEHPFIVGIGDSLWGIYNGSKSEVPLYKGRGIQTLRSGSLSLYQALNFGNQGPVIDTSGVPLFDHPMGVVNVLYDSLIRVSENGRQWVYHQSNKGWKVLVEGKLIQMINGNLVFSPIKGGQSYSRYGLKRLLVEDSNQLKVFDIDSRSFLRKACQMPSNIDNQRKVFTVKALAQNAFSYYRREQAGIHYIVDDDFTIIEKNYDKITRIQQGYVVEINRGATIRMYNDSFELLSGAATYTANRHGYMIETKQGNLYGVSNLNTNEIIIPAQRPERIQFLGMDFIKQGRTLFNGKGEQIQQMVDYARMEQNGLVYSSNGKRGFIYPHGTSIPAQYSRIYSNQQFLVLEKADQRSVYSLLQGKLVCEGDSLVEIRYYRSPSSRYTWVVNRNKGFQLIDAYGTPQTPWLQEEQIDTQQTWLRVVNIYCQQIDHLNQLSPKVQSYVMRHYLFHGYHSFYWRHCQNQHLLKFESLTPGGNAQVQNLLITRDTVQRLLLQDVFDLSEEDLNALKLTLESSVQIGGYPKKICFSPSVEKEILEHFAFYRKGIMFKYEEGGKYQYEQLTVRRLIPYEQLSEQFKLGVMKPCLLPEF